MGKKTFKQKLPEELESLLYKSYLIEIYTKYWEELFDNPPLLQDCLIKKLSNLEESVSKICIKIKAEDIGFDTDTIIDGIDSGFKEQKKQISLLPVLSRFDSSKEMAKLLIKKIMLEGIEKELQSLGVEVVKLRIEEVRFIDKKTKIVLNVS